MARSGIELSENLDAGINQLVSQAVAELHPAKSFIAGETNIPVTGKVFGSAELCSPEKKLSCPVISFFHFVP